MNFSLQSYDTLSMGEIPSLAHLSEINCSISDKNYHIDVFWHKHLQKIVIGFNNSPTKLYSLRGNNHYDLTVRQLLHTIGFQNYRRLEIALDASKAYEFSMEDILDGDLWNTIYHEVYIEMPSCSLVV